jgi:hypothetical protein
MPVRMIVESKKIIYNMRLFKVLLLIVFCSLSEAISHAQPAVFIVTGSGSYCRRSGLVVGLTGSEMM